MNVSLEVKCPACKKVAKYDSVWVESKYSETDVGQCIVDCKCGKTFVVSVKIKAEPNYIHEDSSYYL